MFYIIQFFKPFFALTGAQEVQMLSQLYNLRPLTDSNTLMEAEKDQIWIPSVTFVNTATQVLGYKQGDV